MREKADSDSVQTCTFAHQRMATADSFRILGVDPGLNITGYAVIESGTRHPRICEAGIIRGTESRAKADMAERLCCLYDGIVEVLEQFHPGVMVVEQLYAHYAHPRTAI